MTKKFALEKSFLKGSAIHDDERTVTAIRFRVQSAREKFFTRSALAENENACCGRRNFIDHGGEIHNGRRRADDFGLKVFFFDEGFKGLVFSLK